ncbi:MAG: trypsin-like peptidase domain-containing protein [Planctomycetota bacterium]|nr:trypsin-like peptidase domain-containing protein [Planctomycetota bacterium]
MPQTKRLRGPALLVLLGLLALGTVPSQADQTTSELDTYRASVIQIFVVGQSESYATPWQRPSPERWGGSGFFIGDGRIMTNAHVVANAKRILVKRADVVKKFVARVLFAGHDCDLGMITVDDPAFFEGMKPLEIGERAAMRSKVQTVGYPTGGEKLSVTEGIVSRIEVRTYAHSGADAHLMIQTDAAINPGNSGGPVVQDGKVVGVAFQGYNAMFAQSTGYMIPPSVINHFLVDVSDGTYHGYPELGIYDARLENDSLREYLGVPDGATGVVILKAMPYASCVGLVQRNDVLHAIDGVSINSDGTIKVGDEFLDYTILVEDKQIGDEVTLTIRRDGQVKDVKVPLTGWEARMTPATIYDKRPEYWVVGGYIFVPMTSNYIGWGRSEELAYYMNTYYRTVAEEGKTREQLVILSRVLKHPSTRYISYRDEIVATVDGKAPNDFAHFVELVEKSEKNLVRIEFEGVNVAPLILDKKKIAEVQDEIMKQQGITEDRYVEEQK